jgi:hypothetical protein
MRFSAMTTFAVCVFAARCLGQLPTEPPPVFETVPDFYSNGEKVGQWNYYPERRIRITFHYLKAQSSDLFWHQQIAMKRDAEPGRTYFFDQVTRVWIGYYDEDLGEYSRLPEKYRRFHFSAIRPEWFPKPGPVPSLFNMANKPCKHRHNNVDPLLSAPPDTSDSVEKQ